MGNREKLENPTIEFTTVTFLGLTASDCGMTEEEYQAYIASYDGDISSIETLYGGGN